MPSIHKPCGELVSYAAVPGRPGKFVTLAAYPDPGGPVKVDVVAGGRLVLLEPDQPRSARTKRYERHVCVVKGVRAPEHRAEQLTIGGS